MNPKAKLSVAGEVVEYVCAGAGSSTVVLVNASGGPIEGWYKVFAPIASFAKVFAYNRPGVGGSSKPKTPANRFAHGRIAPGRIA